jgi:hypothetical protein
MNNLQNEINDFERSNRFSVPAKRIMEKIKPLKSNVIVAKKRWFWELLQNASDYNDSVDIELELNQTSLKFRHNGNPFSYNDARNLVEPDSGKDEETDITKRETIGQFGTGFLATHILSLWIKVKGVIESNEQFIDFSFDLDRRGKEHKNQLMTSIQNSIDQLNGATGKAPIDNYVKHRKCDTEFYYDFSHQYDDESGFQVAKYGIENLNHILPYVLSFIPKVKSITVFDNSTSKPEQYTYKGYELIDQHQQTIYLVQKISSIGEILKEDCVVIVKEGETSVAIPVRIHPNGKYEILKVHPDGCGSSLMYI